MAPLAFWYSWQAVPPDVTEQALLKHDQTHELTAAGNPITTCIQHMVDYYCNGQAGQPGVFHMHDPLCMAVVVRPDLLAWQRAIVDIELRGTRTFGEAVAFFKGTG